MTKLTTEEKLNNDFELKPEWGGSDQSITIPKHLFKNGKWYDVSAQAKYDGNTLIVDNLKIVEHGSLWQRFKVKLLRYIKG